MWPVSCARKDNSLHPSAPVPSTAPMPVGHTSGRTILLWQKDAFLTPLCLLVLLQQIFASPDLRAQAAAHSIPSAPCLHAPKHLGVLPHSSYQEKHATHFSHLRASKGFCFTQLMPDLLLTHGHTLPGSGHAHLCVCIPSHTRMHTLKLVPSSFPLTRKFTCCSM